MKHLLCLLVFSVIAIAFRLEAQNDFIFSQVIEKFLAQPACPSSPNGKAQYLNERIDLIAKEAVRIGFALDVYQPNRNQQTAALHFSAKKVWEGKEKNIPLTFFVYAWPAESLALKIGGNDRNYCSSVHSHPISCALTVLRGSMVQENFIPVQGYPYNVAFKTDEEVLLEGSKVIDAQKESMIHRLVCRDQTFPYSLTLHAYGLGSQEEVWNVFRNTRIKCDYPYILHNDGTLCKEVR